MSTSWKRSVLVICLVIWIGTFLLVNRMQKSVNVQKHLYRPQNSLLSAEENQQWSQQPSSEQPNFGRLKKILFFTNFFTTSDWEFGFGQQPFIDYQCPVSNCYTTNNKTLLGSMSEFDAILFHVRDMNNGLIPMPNQNLRKANQRYVMFYMESPANDNFPYGKFDKFFNWTMTYRRDSDFHRPYGWVAPKSWAWHYPASGNQSIDWSQYPMKDTIPNNLSAPGKENLVAWMVSNCHTKSERENYVKELSKHIQVDIFGHCGTHQCPDDSQCHPHIQSKYLFYLSFENSICKDYVTEKFWRPLDGDILPIVMGGSDYKKIAPPHSFIDVEDFESPQALADHLQYLAKNATAYNQYFQWKDYFQTYTNDYQNYARVFCQLCEALNDKDQPVKVYEDLRYWWKNEAHCKRRGSYPWSKPDINSILPTNLLETAGKLLSNLV